MEHHTSPTHTKEQTSVQNQFEEPVVHLCPSTYHQLGEDPSFPFCLTLPHLCPQLITRWRILVNVVGRHCINDHLAVLARDNQILVCAFAIQLHGGFHHFSFLLHVPSVAASCMSIFIDHPSSPSLHHMPLCISTPPWQHQQYASLY